MLQLDHTDLRLLKILHNDSKLTVKELAAQVNLSPSPVFERIRRMEKEGYIKKYIAILDAEKLNQGLIVFCNIRLKQHDRNIGHTFVDDIHNIDEVVECYNVSVIMISAKSSCTGYEALSGFCFQQTGITYQYRKHT